MVLGERCRLELIGSPVEERFFGTRLRARSPELLATIEGAIESFWFELELTRPPSFPRKWSRAAWHAFEPTH